MEEIYQIYDRIFKRIFSMSNLAIINLINGLFGTNYPPDSTVSYPNKEYVNRKLDKRFADIFIIINGRTYHLEAQMYKDKTIVLRAFEYGFYLAVEQQEDNNVLRFPEPIIIYLDNEIKVSEKSILKLDFGTQGSFSYEVRNFLYQEHDIVELNQKKMIILIPFHLLKLRKLIQEHPTPENFEQLKHLIHHDILGSIQANLRVGNITDTDAHTIWTLSVQLYRHVYEHYEELGGCQPMRELLEGAMELPMDKYIFRIDELEEENAKLQDKALKAQKDREKAQKDKEKAEKDNYEAQEEIRKLRERLKELEHS